MSSRSRVLDSTSGAVNERLCRDTAARVEYFRSHPEKISQRLKELDNEWDIERVLETGSAGISLFGLLMTVTSNSRRWLILPFAVQAFFMQHALQGWCPPLPLFRRLGVRTVEEIESERYALRALRGDLKDISPEDLVLENFKVH